MTATTQDLILSRLRTPSIPAMVVRLNELLDDADVCIDEIARAISEDLSISAMVLRNVNSAYYGLREPVAQHRARGHGAWARASSRRSSCRWRC